jgi:hypothetical protein
VALVGDAIVSATTVLLSMALADQFVGWPGDESCRMIGPLRCGWLCGLRFARSRHASPARMPVSACADRLFGRATLSAGPISVGLA